MREGLAGEASLDGTGELEAEAVRLGWRRGRAVAGESRGGLEVLCVFMVVAGAVVAVVVLGVDVEVGVDVDVDVVAVFAAGVNAGAGWLPAAIDPAVSRVALGTAAEGLSSIVGAMMFASRAMGMEGADGGRRVRVEGGRLFSGGGAEGAGWGEGENIGKVRQGRVV